MTRRSGGGAERASDGDAAVAAKLTDGTDDDSDPISPASTVPGAERPPQRPDRLPQFVANCSPNFSRTFRIFGSALNWQ